MWVKSDITEEGKMHWNQMRGPLQYPVESHRFVLSVSARFPAAGLCFSVRYANPLQFTLFSWLLGPSRCSPLHLQREPEENTEQEFNYWPPTCFAIRTLLLTLPFHATAAGQRCCSQKAARTPCRCISWADLLHSYPETELPSLCQCS